MEIWKYWWSVEHCSEFSRPSSQCGVRALPSMGIENNSNSDVSSSLKRKNNRSNPSTILHNLRKNNPLRAILVHINLSSIRNIFVDLKELVFNNIDILMISETKIGNCFPITEFCISGYSFSYHLNRNSKFGWFLLEGGYSVQKNQ